MNEQEEFEFRLRLEQETAQPSTLDSIKQGAGNLAAGAVRGAGSIGATILAPVDMARDALAGKGLSLESNRQRRADMDSALQSMGAEPDSLLYKTGKLGGEIAGTAGAGGVLANGVRAAGATRAMSGLEPIVNGVARGLETGGFRVGELAGTGLGAATRIGTGVAAGGATAGLVNPEDVGTGMLIGGALPGGAQLSGKAGDLTRAAFGRGAPAVTPEMLDTARRSMQAGYIIPPSMVKPSFANRLLESQSGKFETAQLAATKNQGVTDSLVRKALGLAEDAPLSQEAMQGIRKQAGQVYQQIKGAGQIKADPAYMQALDAIADKYKTAAKDFPSLGPTNMHGKPIDQIGDLVKGLKVGQFDSSSAIDAIGVLREAADKAFMSGDKVLGKASKDAARAMEDVIERHLQTTGDEALLGAFKDARRTIAKTYTVEKALREGAGTVDARVLGREVQKGKPITGELLTAGQFGNVFNKAAQPPHLIGSPGVNTLKNTLALLTGGAGAAAMGPAGVALGGLNYVVPPVARSVMFSPRFQRGLLDQAPGMLDETAPLGLLTRGAYRSAPVLTAQ
jgi:histone H3/H4